MRRLTAKELRLLLEEGWIHDPAGPPANNGVTYDPEALVLRGLMSRLVLSDGRIVYRVTPQGELARRVEFLVREILARGPA